MVEKIGQQKQRKLNVNKELEDYYFKSDSSNVDLNSNKTNTKEKISAIIKMVNELKETKNAEIERLIVQKRKETLLSKFK
ncbi:hypothetical protein QEN19_003438 [Hanseniaspora menglaensis]